MRTKTVACLIKHIEQFHPGAKHICELCGEVCNYRINLNIHKRSHMTAQYFKCIDCKEKFETIDLLKEHVISHREKKFQCYLCSKTFTHQDDLKSHKATHRSFPPDERFGEYNCVICNTTFGSAATIALHLANKHSNMDHRCPICFRKFDDPAQLRVHTWSHVGDGRWQGRI